MKTATTALRNLIESGQFCRADLYTITLIDGTIIRTTNADIALTWGATTWQPGAPPIVRETIRQALGLEVDELNLSVYPRRASQTTYGTPIVNDDGSSTAGYVDIYGGGNTTIAATGGRLRITRTGSTGNGYYKTLPTTQGLVYRLQGTMFPHEGTRARIVLVQNSVAAQQFYYDISGGTVDTTFVATALDQVYLEAADSGNWVSVGEYAEFDNIIVSPVIISNAGGSESSVSDTISGLEFANAVRLGMLDGATVLLEKAYLPNWDQPVTGVLFGFKGKISDIDGGRTGFNIPVKSSMELLNTEMPRNLFQSTCLHSVYDLGCTLNKASFTTTGAVTSAVTPTTNKLSSGLTQADGYFDLGVIAFTSGANNGFRRTIKRHLNSNGTIEFSLPLPVAPAVGDTFSIYPGCDRNQSTCGSKFSNLAHFKGYPYVPNPETVY